MDTNDGETSRALAVKRASVKVLMGQIVYSVRRFSVGAYRLRSYGIAVAAETMPRRMRVRVDPKHKRKQTC
jgi:hypothetical protein